MLARALLLVTAAILLAGCVDSQRLRSNLGGPPAPSESRQELQEIGKFSRSLNLPASFPVLLVGSTDVELSPS